MRRPEAAAEEREAAAAEPEAAASAEQSDAPDDGDAETTEKESTD